MRKSKKMNEKESVSFGERVRVISSTSREDYYWYYIVSITLMLLGTIIPVLCFAESFDLVYRVDAVLLVGVSFAVLFWGVFYLRRFMKYSIPVLIIILAYVGFHYKGYIENGFYYIENAVIDKVNRYYDVSLYSYLTELEEETCVTWLLIVPMLLLSVSLGMVVHSLIRRNLYLIISIPLVLSGFIVGIIPPEIPLCAYILLLYMLFGMMSSPYGRKKKNKRTGSPEYRDILRMKMAAVTGIVLCLLGAVIVLLFQPKDYEAHVDVTDAKNQIQTSLYEFSFEDLAENIREALSDIHLFSAKEENGTRNYLQGGLSGGKLKTTGAVEFKNTTALKLTTIDVVGGTYLKGFAGANYNGEKWKELSEQQEERYLDIVKQYGRGAYTGENLSSSYLELIQAGVIGSSGADSFSESPYIVQIDMDVDYINANEGFLYAPYFLSENSLENYDIESIADLYLKPRTHRSSYTYSFYKIFDESNLLQLLEGLQEYDKTMEIKEPDAYERFASFERAYRKFVYQNYVGIPEEEFPGIKELNLGIAKVQNTEEMIAAVRDIRNFLSDNMIYSLDPGDLPEGKDFIEYFLFENQKGYCAHFASAAVMLLRYYGVPARYVEGYIVTEQDVSNGTLGNHGIYATYDLDRNQRIEFGSSVTMEIRDTNAHAWVEVYLDGVGWIPVEMTAGYSEDGISELNNSIEEKVQEQLSPTPVPTNTPRPTVTLPQAVTEKPTMAPEEEIETEKKNNTEEEKEDLHGEQVHEETSGILILMVRIFLLLLIITIIFILRYYIFSYFRVRGIRKDNANQAAIYIYQEIGRVLYILGYKKTESETYEEFFERVAEEYTAMPGDYQEVLMLVMKAKFSKEGITIQEKEEIYHFYEKLRQGLYQGLKPVPRFYTRYWKVI